MTTSKFRDALIAQDRRAAGFAQHRQIVNAELVEVDGSVEVSGRPGFVWAREDGQPGSLHQVFNPSVAARAGLSVLIARYPDTSRRSMIEGVNWELLAIHPDFDGDPYLAFHHISHEWPSGSPGADVVQVYPRAIVPLRTYADSGLTVNVVPGRYMHGSSIVEFTGETGVDISSHQPASGLACYVLVYVDVVTNTVASVAGEAVTDNPAIPPELPSMPPESIPSAAIRLDGDQTSISEGDIIDIRSLLVGPTVGRDQILDLENELDELITDLEVTLFQRVLQQLALFEDDIEARLTDMEVTLATFVTQHLSSLEDEIDAEISQHVTTGG